MREPITFPVLIKLLDHCTGKGVKQQCTRAGMLLAYFGLLRPGEWTQRSSYKPDPIRTLRLRHVVFFPSLEKPTYMRLIIPMSKTDQVAAGRSVIIAKCNGRVCPVSFLRQFLIFRYGSINNILSRLSRGGNEWLLDMGKGRPLSYGILRNALTLTCNKLGLNPRKYTPHSFRIGGATWLLQQGVPLVVIKHMGGWKSDAVERYVRPSVDYLTGISQRMAIPHLRRSVDD